MLRTIPGSGYKGTARQRHRRRKEVAGPYRSQSSNPAIRSKATPAEHRKLPVPPTPAGSRGLGIPTPADLATPPPLRPRPAFDRSLLRGLGTLTLDPQTAYLNASLHGIEPPAAVRDRFNEEGGLGTYEKIAQIARRTLASKEGLKEPEDLTNAILAATGIGDIASLLGRQGIKDVAAAATEAGAKQAASSAERQGLAEGLAQFTKGAARKGIVRPALRKAAAKAEPEAVAATRRAIAERAAQVVERVPRPIRVGAKVAGQRVSAPIKHPFTAPLAVQAPAAFVHGGHVGFHPAALLAALEGKGTYANIAKTASDALSHLAPVAGEALDLPATVLPSTYLTGKAGVEAAQGNPQPLHELLKQWEATGLLPAIAKGDTAGIVKAIETHPLYSLLEGSGAVSAVGRGAGAVARGVSGGRLGGLARPDLTIEGYPNVAVERGYSRDLIRQLAQRAHDRATGNMIRPGTRRGNRQFRRAVVRDAGDRFQANAEAVRRQGKEEVLKAAQAFAPKKRMFLLAHKLDQASADVVAHAIERVIQHPETFHQDLADYKRSLEAVAKEKHPDGTPALDRSQLAANRELVKQIDKGIKRASPEHVVEAADSFIEAHAPIVDELVARGVLQPDQALKAAVIPFARVHMGAGYTEGVGVTDAAGNPLSLEQIQAEMRSRGIEPPGFLSHRPPTRGDWYRSWYPERGSLPKGARTGESVATGSRDAGWESVVRQLARARGLRDRVRAWDGFITRFGVDLRGAGVKNMRDAHRVLRDPARYGLNPKIDWVPVRRNPFIAMKSEIEGALEHQDPVIATEGVLAKALDTATNVDSGPDGPIVFMPKGVVDNMAQHFAPLDPGLKAMQLTTTALKRAVLPFSPSFYFGNAIDNAIRTALAGIGPHHFVIGKKVADRLTPEERAQVISGAHFSSVDRLAARRTAEDFRGTALEGLANALAHVRATPGPKQLIGLISAGSHFLLAVNAHLTETLPQYGALGKIAMRDIEATQGHWASALKLQPKVIEDVAKGLENSDTVTRYQKEIEAIYGNWTRLSPAARKFLSNFVPFWTWARAATRLVFLTMPAHHPIQTAILTAAARMTQKEREHLGLDKLGAEPLPNFLQGGLPIRGSISPWGKYTSFGFSGNVIESLPTMVIPQLRDALANLEGRDWKGDEIGGGEIGHVGQAFVSGLESFLPGYNTVMGVIEKGPGYLSPVHVEPPGALPYLRSLSHSKQITVPTDSSGSGSSSSGVNFNSVFSQGSDVNYGSVFSGGGGSAVNYGSVFSGQ